MSNLGDLPTNSGILVDHVVRRAVILNSPGANTYPIPDASAQALTWATDPGDETLDTHDFHDFTNTTRITFGTAGYYLFGLQVTWTNRDHGYSRAAWVALNGNSASRLSQHEGYSAGPNNFTVNNLCRPRGMAANDYIEGYVYKNDSVTDALGLEGVRTRLWAVAVGVAAV